MRRMAQLQLQEMQIATGQVGDGAAAAAGESPTPAKQKQRVFRGLFGRKNSNKENDTSDMSGRSKSSSRIQYKSDSFLAKTKQAPKVPKDRDMSDPALQEALAASIAEASGREHVSETTKRRAHRRADSADHELEMALALSASEASVHQRGRSPSVRNSKSERSHRWLGGRSRSSDGLGERSKSPGAALGGRNKSAGAALGERSKSPGAALGERSKSPGAALQRAKSTHSRTPPPGLDRANSVHGKRGASTHMRSKSPGGPLKRGARSTRNNSADMTSMAPGEERYDVARQHGSSWSSVEEAKTEESDDNPAQDGNLDPMVARNDASPQTRKKRSPATGSPSKNGPPNRKSPTPNRKGRSPPNSSATRTPPSKAQEANESSKRGPRSQSHPPRGRAPRKTTNDGKELTTADVDKLSPPRQHSAPRRHPSRDPPLRRSPEQQMKRSLSAPRPVRKKPLGENNSSSPNSSPEGGRRRPLKKPSARDQSLSPEHAKRGRPLKKVGGTSSRDNSASPSAADSSGRSQHTRSIKPNMVSRASSAPTDTDHNGRSQHQRRPMKSEHSQRGTQRSTASSSSPTGRKRQPIRAEAMRTRALSSRALSSRESPESDHDYVARQEQLQLDHALKASRMEHKAASLHARRIKT